jgi:hypothetical protein
MTCSAARRVNGRASLKLILSEESPGKTGSRRQPETDGPPPARTGAFYEAQDDERMPAGAALCAIVLMALIGWSFVLAGVVAAL